MKVWKITILYHCKNKSVVLIIEWLTWLHAVMLKRWWLCKIFYWYLVHKATIEATMISDGIPREDPGMSMGSSRQHGGPVCGETLREDPGMSKGSSGQQGGLCLRGSQGRIPGCPRDPLDSMGACVWGDPKGGSRDVQGILWTAWAACIWGDTKGGSQDVQGILWHSMGSCVRWTWREDPGMS